MGAACSSTSLTAWFATVCASLRRPGSGRDEDPSLKGFGGSRAVRRPGGAPQPCPYGGSPMSFRPSVIGAMLADYGIPDEAAAYRASLASPWFREGELYWPGAVPERTLPPHEIPSAPATGRRRPKQRRDTGSSRRHCAITRESGVLPAGLASHRSPARVAGLAPYAARAEAPQGLRTPLPPDPRSGAGASRSSHHGAFRVSGQVPDVLPAPAVRTDPESTASGMAVGFLLGQYQRGAHTAFRSGPSRSRREGSGAGTFTSVPGWGVTVSSLAVTPKSL